MGSKKLESVAIIGAGMSGISCAAALRQAIPRIKVFEKLPAAGGRMCSFRAGEHQYDGGAQYFTARSAAFQQQIARWKQDWLAVEWEAWLVDLHLGEALSREDGVTRYVGRPVMQSCIEDMAGMSEVQYQAEVGKVVRTSKRWELFSNRDEELGDYDAVVVAVPPPQALPLLQTFAPGLAKTAQSINMMPCWSVMLAFEQPLNLGFDAAFLVMPKLTWAARDSSKPDRKQQEVWVLHGSPEWSGAHRELEPIDVVMQFLQDFELATRSKLPMPSYVDARFWPVALAVNSLAEGFLYDSKLQLGLCGDWCKMPRVEGAYLSGISLAAELLKYADT